ncbi:hypothetical protein BTS2_3742 [Bacillus sp. TS-2]|nr:hypothetical protein BTS2_3742 [Bacillus sp. TS-2]
MENSITWIGLLMIGMVAMVFVIRIVRGSSNKTVNHLPTIDGETEVITYKFPSNFNPEESTNYYVNDVLKGKLQRFYKGQSRYFKYRNVHFTLSDYLANKDFEVRQENENGTKGPLFWGIYDQNEEKMAQIEEIEKKILKQHHKLVLRWRDEEWVMKFQVINHIATIEYKKENDFIFCGTSELKSTFGSEIQTTLKKMSPPAKNIEILILLIQTGWASSGKV